jgi:hypothetical protein
MVSDHIANRDTGWIGIVKAQVHYQVRISKNFLSLLSQKTPIVSPFFSNSRKVNVHEAYSLGFVRKTLFFYTYTLNIFKI